MFCSVEMVFYRKVEGKTAEVRSSLIFYGLEKVSGFFDDYRLTYLF